MPRRIASSEGDRAPVTPPVALRRALGLGQLTASGVGIIIGAGIYVLLGDATALTGAGVWLAFLVAGLLSALTALSYAELAAMFPEAGAEYDYTRRVAPPWLAFLVGWVMVAGLVGAAAAVSLGFGAYLRHFVDVPERLGALALLAVVVAVASAGVSRSAALTVALSLVQVAGLVLVVVIGVPHLGDHSLTAGLSGAGVISGAALVFFAFIGFDEVITLAEETRDPSQTVPRALLLALGVSTALYMAVAVAAVSILGAGALGRSERPLADAMSSALGSASSHVVAGIALIATANTTLLAITAASRLQYGMASSGALPARLHQLNAQAVPQRALGLAAVAAAVFVGVGDVALVASITDVAIYLVFLAVNVTVVLLRFRQPDRPRPFRMVPNVGRLPLAPIAAVLTVAMLLPGMSWGALGAGVALTLIGLAVHLSLRRPHGRVRRRPLTSEGGRPRSPTVRPGGAGRR
jgi:APA family basic amino acid/polyamine antiporter